MVCFLHGAVLLLFFCSCCSTRGNSYVRFYYVLFSRQGANLREAEKEKRKSMKRSMKRVAKDAEKSRKTTVSQDFKASLAALIGEMTAAEPHFVRCIKPNMEKRADCFVDDLTTKQLRYTGPFPLLFMAAVVSLWRLLFVMAAAQ